MAKILNYLEEHGWLKRCGKCRSLNLSSRVKRRRFLHPHIKGFITSQQEWCPKCDKGMKNLVKYEEALQQAAKEADKENEHNSTEEAS